MFPFVTRVSCVLLAGLPAQSAQPQIPSQRLSGVTPSPVLRHLGRQPGLQPRGVGQLIQGVWTPGRCVPGKWPLQTADHTPLRKSRQRRPSPEKISRCCKEQKCAKVKMQGLVQLQTFQSCERCKERNQLFFLFAIFCFFILLGFFFSPCDASLTMRFVTLRRTTFYIYNCAFVGKVTMPFSYFKKSLNQSF